jgi:hypothetical protein
MVELFHGAEVASEISRAIYHPPSPVFRKRSVNHHYSGSTEAGTESLISNGSMPRYSQNPETRHLHKKKPGRQDAGPTITMSGSERVGPRIMTF